MAEKQYFRRGDPSAEWLAVRLFILQLPVIVLLVCIFPGLEPEPKHPATTHADRSGPDHLGMTQVREDLAAVQVELMQVMRTDPDRTCALQQREEQLKYELRTGSETPRS